jgi:putative lumazine-binding protein
LKKYYGFKTSLRLKNSNYQGLISYIYKKTYLVLSILFNPNIMKKLFCTLSLFFITITLLQATDDTEKIAVENVVKQLFYGMRIGDSTLVRSLFNENAVMYSLSEINGNPTIHEGSLQRFITAVGTPHEEIWDEQIWGTKIEIDGPLATVWTNYVFYIGDKFSHCGIDLFQMIRSKDGWKIFQLTDTRRKENCKEQEIKK